MEPQKKTLFLKNLFDFIFYIFIRHLSRFEMPINLLIKQSELSFCVKSTPAAF